MGRALTLTDFLGRWAVTRDIRHDDGTEARFEGAAVWTPVAQADCRVTLLPCAWCTETGWLHIPGQGRFEAERRYLWDAALRVHFDDGRFFHAVPPTGGVSTHLCDPDRYTARYDFSAWPDWTCGWRVDGPRKAYTMTARFRRAAA